MSRLTGASAPAGAATRLGLVPAWREAAGAAAAALLDDRVWLAA